MSAAIKQSEEAVFPSLPSQMIREAINALEEVEQDEDYEVRMNVWTEYYEEIGICLISLEGATAIKCFGYRDNENLNKLPIVLKNKLIALDEMRRGELESASCRLSVDKNYQKTNRIMKKWWPVDYQSDPKRFKENLLKLARFYEEEKL